MPRIAALCGKFRPAGLPIRLYTGVLPAENLADSIRLGPWLAVQCTGMQKYAKIAGSRVCSMDAQTEFFRDRLNGEKAHAQRLPYWR